MDNHVEQEIRQAMAKERSLAWFQEHFNTSAEGVFRMLREHQASQVDGLAKAIEELQRERDSLREQLDRCSCHGD